MGSQQQIASLEQQITETRQREQQLQRRIQMLEQQLLKQTAEAALEEQAKFLHAIYNGVEHLIFVVDVLPNEDFRIVGWNHATERATGVSSQHIQNQTPEEVFGSAEGAQVRQRYQQCAIANSPITYEECLTLQGHETWWLTTLNPMADESGRVYRIVGTTFGITEQKQQAQALQQLNEDLEERVEERTEQLQHLVLRLQDEIRERQETAAQLKNSQERLKLIIENSPLAIIEWNPNAEIRGWNPAAEKIFGFSQSEVLGSQFEFLIPPDSRAAVRTVLTNITHQSDSLYSINDNLTKDGRVITCEWYNKRLATPDGTFLGLLSMATDISDRKAAERALRESEQRFRDVSEAAGEYLWELDANGIYTFVSERVKVVKGYAPAELLGHSPFDFMPAEDMTLVQAILEDACTRKGSFKLQHRDITPSGAIVWEEVNGVPLLNDQGEIIGFRGAGLSITERKEAELNLWQLNQTLEQRSAQLTEALSQLSQSQLQLIQTEKMSSLGQLVAGIAHEINNPVNFIHGNLGYAHEYVRDLLKIVQLYQHHYPNATPEIQQAIATIDLEFLVDDLTRLLKSMQLGTDRIREIVLSLRNFSRLDEAEVKEVNLHEGIESTLTILHHRLKAKPNQPEIHVIKEFGSLPLVECYASQFNQALMNILSNAIDALEERDSQRSHQEIQAEPSQIRIHTEHLQPGWVAIRITDNGPGIDEAVQSKLFDPFFTTKTVGKGTGLGLSISQQIIVERHQGHLSCRSQPGQGTEFIIEVPIVRD